MKPRMEERATPPASDLRPIRTVLFLCAHNSARSQMAEGFARARGSAEARVMSAGTKAGKVHPLAIEVMREVGIDLGAHASKTLKDVPWREADTVVTLCEEGARACPTVPGDVRRLHWPLPDPSAAPSERALETFRAVRDEIGWRVASLWPQGD